MSEINSSVAVTAQPIAPVRKDPKTDPKIAAMKRHEARKDYDLEMVYGIFENKEKKGKKFEFSFKGPYPECEYTTYVIADGERLKLPRMVAHHLNKNVFYVEYKLMNNDLKYGSQAKSERDDYQMYSETKLRRVAFHPLDYMEDEYEDDRQLINVVRK